MLWWLRSKSAAFVYAIGELQYDFPSVLREHSVRQNMDNIDAEPSYVPNTRNPVDFLRHLFGYNEIELTDVTIGDIDSISVTSSNYRLTVDSTKGETFRLRFKNLATKEISTTASAAKIDEEITALAGVGEQDVTVTDVTPTGSSKHQFLIEFQLTASKSELVVDSETVGGIALVEPLGRLRVTVSDGPLLTSEVEGRQIAFNGVGIGEGNYRRSSVLNSCNGMFVRHVCPSDKDGRQLIYVDASEVDENAKLTMSERITTFPSRIGSRKSTAQTCTMRVR